MRLSALVPWVLGVAGCQAQVDPVDYSVFPLALGAKIDKISWLQGVERTLHLGEGQFGSGSRPPPIIVGREAVLRVHVSADERFEASEVAVVLDYQYPPFRSQLSEIVSVAVEWTQNDLGTTATFQIPAHAVVDDLHISVSLHDPYLGYRTPIEDVPPPVWSSDETELPYATTDVLRIVVVPVRYAADGSNRLPDISTGAMNDLRNVLFAMYPVSAVDLEVAEPLTYGTPIGPFNGWEGLLSQIQAMRTQASDEPDKTYFYGLFDPAETFADYCTGGCILGLSNYAGSPTDTWARSSIGLGYREWAADTMVHEVGHAHGRLHAPCGVNGDDGQFPYMNARLGSWGYDIVDEVMIDPNATADIMSYCDPIWVSDYTFGALLERVRALSDEGTTDSQSRAVPRIDWQLVTFDGAGVGTVRSIVQARPEPGGDRVEVELLDAGGVVVEVVDAFFLPFDHLDGGTALVPVSAVRRAGVVGLRLP